MFNLNQIKLISSHTASPSLAFLLWQWIILVVWVSTDSYAKSLHFLIARQDLRLLRLYDLLRPSWHVELKLPALLFQKLLKFLLANGLGHHAGVGLDRSIPLLGAALPEPKTIVYLQVLALDDLAYRPIDDLIPAVY